MSPRAEALFVSDLITAIRRIGEYVAPLDQDAFMASALVQDAVIRNLEVLGEAARNLDEDLREAHPEIPWRRMIGLRNIVAHQYFGLDLGMIWTIATVDVPGVRTDVERLAASIGLDI